MHAFDDVSRFLSDIKNAADDNRGALGFMPAQACFLQSHARPNMNRVSLGTRHVLQRFVDGLAQRSGLSVNDAVCLDAGPYPNNANPL